MQRTIILLSMLSAFLLFSFINDMFFFTGKSDQIADLQQKQEKVNETYITAQILSQRLKHVYALFQNNLAFSKNDDKNKDASIDFLEKLTNLTDSLGIKTNKIYPKPKVNKGRSTFIPYEIEFECDYEMFGQFLAELESNERLVITNEFDFSNSLEKIQNNSKLKVLPDQHIKMKISTITLNKSAR